jgi:hypothetical protein
MQNRNPGGRSKGLTPTCGEWKQHKITPFLSSARVKRSDAKHQPRRKSGSLLGIPNMFFEPYHNSREATSVLRFLYDHLCTATVPQRQQNTGIMFRHYQRIDVISHDNEQDVFPGSNRLRQKTRIIPSVLVQAGCIIRRRRMIRGFRRNAFSATSSDLLLARSVSAPSRREVVSGFVQATRWWWSD